MRAVLYLRVSTANGQTTDNQRLELEAAAVRNRWQVVEIYEDAGVSGAKGRQKRPAFDRMLKAAVRRESMSSWLGRSIGSGVRSKTWLGFSPISMPRMSSCICTDKASIRPRHRARRCSR